MIRVIKILIKCSTLIAILGGVLFYFDYKPIGCMLMFLGSFITLIKLINKRNKQKSEMDSTTGVYAVTPWDSSTDCSSSDSGNSSDCGYYGDYSSSSDCGDCSAS